MTRLTLTEQSRLAKLLVDRTCRAASARLKQSPLLNWRYGPAYAEKLLLMPVELRQVDPTFANELEFGHIGLAGTLVIVGDGSPFDAIPPNAAWARELHGFSWLRHLQAAETATARDFALMHVADWCRRNQRPRQGYAWEPAVIGRRITSWIANGSMILEGVAQTVYDITMDSLADQLIHLSSVWPQAEPGLPRLQALSAMLLANLSIAGHDRNLRAMSDAFSAELTSQILPDGGHISRNPGALVALLLDFLPLRQCFITREKPLPAEFDETIGRMLKMLRYLRLGDKRLARFNGMSGYMTDALSTVMAYDDMTKADLPSAAWSKYARLTRGPIVLVMDVGQPPPMEVSSEAHAGCLSFELSARSQPMFVNCGAPATSASEWQAAARATSSHNTVCIGGKSSSKLVRDDRLEALVGGLPIRFPSGVESKIASRDGGVEIDAFHDGYFYRFKLLHRRHIEIDAEGTKVIGIDRLGPQRGQLRLVQDVPYAIHFHLDPTVTCQSAGESTAILKLRDGQIWRFTCGGAGLSLEDGMSYGDFVGPQVSQQIVLRAATFGESEVKWSVERVS